MMSPVEREERRILAQYPGLSAAQKAVVLDPDRVVEEGRMLVTLLKKKAAAWANKSESEKDLDRACGLTQTIGVDTVTNDGVVQTFGGNREVPRNG